MEAFSSIQAMFSTVCFLKEIGTASLPCFEQPLSANENNLHDLCDVTPSILQQQVQFPGTGDSLGAIADTQFAVDIAGVLFDGADNNKQLIGDLLVG